ncbi:MAG: hypothetical protein Q7T57_00780 [Dehalococcoidales bacterium]|nr:hypothetical protein [Dehalococcoidales bacterium]
MSGRAAAVQAARSAASLDSAPPEQQHQKQRRERERERERERDRSGKYKLT